MVVRNEACKPERTIDLPDSLQGRVLSTDGHQEEIKADALGRLHTWGIRLQLYSSRGIWGFLVDTRMIQVSS